MGMSINTVNDEKIINLAREARNAGATVQLVTDEMIGMGIMDVKRTITITYQTHSTESRVLGRKRELDKEPSVTEQRQQEHADVVGTRMAMKAKVLLLNNRGLTNAEIADVLGIYESAVVHLLEIFTTENNNKENN
jgi:hypothetical protein